MIGGGESGVGCGVGRKVWGESRGGVAGLGRVVATLWSSSVVSRECYRPISFVQLLRVSAAFDLRCILDMTADVRRT